MSEIKLKNYLNNYFDSLIEYKHLALRTNTILFNDLKRFDSEDSKLRFASSLVLRDWSGKTDNGWAYAYPTDSMLETTKESYPEFINDLISKQFCLFYVQSFEGLERLLKNLIFEFASIDVELKSTIESELKKKKKVFSRANMPSGECLRKIVEGQLDSFLYGKDKMQFDLKTSFFILSETRHNIIHNNYILHKNIISSPERKNLFFELFMCDEIGRREIKVKLDILHFKNLMDFMCHFSFQIFKKLCLKHNLNWKIYKNMDKN